ncbi:MAG: helix-turn-helix domain-containing protein [Ruminococcus sp.]|nr:helix-turn-helix domain-containing protein [Ruminococcus sp.]
MELSKQIRKYRTEAKLSQEELAEKIFVSRQTISNWENDKNYPDIKSLVLMSEVFQVSLDNLIKGDIERMKKEIDAQEYAKFQRESNIYAVMFIVLLVVPIPLIMFLEWLGVALYAVLFVVTIVFAFRVEKYKKKYDIQTYKEIIAFTEGNSLTELEKAREEGKRPYQKILLAVGSALLTLIIAFIMIAVIKALF